MRPNFVVAAILGLALTSAASGRADEPTGRLGRLFRFGGSSSNPATPPPPPNTDAAPPPPPLEAVAPPSSPSAGPAPRLFPQPRVSRPITESDPLLTRVAIGRSDSTAQFGLFLQVFADGTVLDSEGVHRIDRESLIPLIRAIESADTSKLKGHCGGPPTDFVEQVHMVVYERTFRGLRANAFSYSGNPQGCDPSVKALQVAADALQARLAATTSGHPATTPAQPGLGHGPSVEVRVATPADLPTLDDAAPPPPPASSIPLIPAP